MNTKSQHLDMKHLVASKLGIKRKPLTCQEFDRFWTVDDKQAEQAEAYEGYGEGYQAYEDYEASSRGFVPRPHVQVPEVS